MPNEMLFLTHAGICLALTFAALRAGKEALVVWVALQAVLANLFVLKQIDCFSLTITCSDVYIIGSMCALNFIQEFYGKAAAVKTVILSFATLVIFSLFCVFHLAYSPSWADCAHENYKEILNIVPKLTIISIIVFFISQRADVLFFTFLKKFSWPFPLRSALCLLCSQALDTGLFTLLALRNLVEDPLAVFLVSYTIKVTLILLMSSLTQMGKAWLPRST